MILADTLARVRLLESRNMSVMVSFCTNFKTSFDRSKNYTKLVSSDREREIQRERQKQTETDRQAETDRHTDRDLIEPFIGAHSNSEFGPNKQQTLSCAGGQG